jgi:hypothetical protein
MNAEFTPDVEGNQPDKPSSSNRRSHRGSRNRPVLVTARSSDGTELDAPNAEIETPLDQEVVAEASATAGESIPVKAAPRRLPGFFTNISRGEKTTAQPDADPKAVRMARALQGKTAEPSAASDVTKVATKKAATSQSKASTTSTKRYTPARPGGFKMRYILGMMIYLIVADFLGVWIASFMKAQHIDAVVFTLGPIQASRSTLLFLAILIILLIVMAHFDLIPRSLGAALGGGSQSKNSNTKNTSATFEPKAPAPTIKQGVQGEDDDLYQTYRENQRYFQKRDRKRS